MLDWLDDPEADQFGNTARVDRLLVDAYVDVVHVVDESPVPWNLRFGAGESSPIPNLFTWPVGVREIEASSTLGAKILQVCPLDDDNREQKPYTIVSFNERNNREHSTGIYIAAGFAVDTAAATTGHNWILGQCDQLRTKALRARVYWRVPVGTIGFEFGSASDVPVLVPLEYQYLIAVRAALLAKIQAKREHADLVDLWLEGKRSLMSFTGDVDQGSYRV